MDTVFPEQCGPVLANKTFQTVFETEPKWIECVHSCWTDNCTGLWLQFHSFVQIMLQNPAVQHEHEERCREYVKTLDPTKIPEYLVKYSQHDVDGTINDL